MEIVNAVLLMCALILVWGAINLERPGAQRVELNQSDQLNDSINFLKKLKKPSAKEQSQDRRAQAFKSHVDSVSEEIPSTMDSIEESFEQIQYGQRRKVKQLQQLVTDIHTQLETSNQLQSTTTTQSMEGLVELKEQIATLSQIVPQLKNYIEHNSSVLEELHRDTQMVKESVGY
jgi:archaellum component FlaC|tara:strand:+ start:1396 stop:1920 length:525 start_codon:yes stop_codon:yes gene_type:complete